MPAPVPYSSPHSQPPYPALYLYPLQDSFVPKHISLAHNQRVKIGRQTNAKTVPGERNGYFDSKVLSRQHAEVWEDNNKIYIKDVKSSNGTFINGNRLSAEGLESEPWVLNTDDLVEFGIDIVGEDNKTIVHHKVAARVFCVFNEQDLQVAAHAEQHQASAGVNGVPSQAGPSSGGPGSSFNFASGPSNQRRMPQQQNLGGMGGMGQSMRAPGKNGLTFDHILSRLQGELQKSRETGAELHNLTGAMNEIHDTLGGALPPNLPPYPQVLPPVRPSSSSPEHSQAQPERQTSISPSDSNPALREIQSQLHDTQSSLASHVDKIRALEGVFAEHEAMKREVSSLREMVEERRREIDHESEAATEDDDTRSINTVVPHELERVEEEDEEDLAAEEEEDDRRRRRDELGRPRTPEPTSMGMDNRDHEEYREGDSSRRPSSPPAESTSTASSASDPHPARPRSATARATPSPSVIDELTQRLDALSVQLESALSLSTSLQAQHTAAQSTISALESKVSALESMVQATQSQVQAVQEIQAAPPVEHHETERESLTQMLNEWKTGVEGQWSSVQEEWTQERERLSRAREEWEHKIKSVEAGLGKVSAHVDSGLTSLAASLEARHRSNSHVGNGDAKHNGVGIGGGLVTPPSPRSLSSDSNRPRQRRRRSASSRGRSRSVSPGLGASVTDAKDAASHDSATYASSIGSDNLATSEDTDDSHSVATSEGKDGAVVSAGQLATPADSLRQLTPPTKVEATATKGEELIGPRTIFDPNPINISTAVGVLVLSVAAAAVVWRVKPE